VQVGQAMQAGLQHAVPASGLLERPAKRRDNSPRAGSSDGMEDLGKMARNGATGEDEEQAMSTASKEQMESEAGETAASVLASFSLGLSGGRSPSPEAEHDDGTTPDAEPSPDNDDEEDGVPTSNDDAAPPSTGRLEQLAMFALQSLAAMEPVRDRSPLQPDNTLSREVSEESSASTLATPRTVVNVSRDGCSRSKMAIEQLTATTPSSVPSSPTPCDVNM